MKAELIKLYTRDLDRLKNEIEAFQRESNLWVTKGEVKNSAGNLFLHLVGNLKTYIGKNLGNYAYVRDREAEFTLKDVPAQTLIEQINETKEIVLHTLHHLREEELEETHKEEVLGYAMTNRYFLIHLLAHLSYHLGQINYLRRVLEE
ncbi:DinB family protein [Rufibacter tibetensis]|uniref:DinB superfamily protein n=1 Tax=Rufibacter tibetensis TaxID=512763 RepID=A0A0P0D195_9BACT|nr:DinB family protein [Rufibacter tibetensis]ALJ00821.1 DinB superfamily protein [Rufibacter tibetensis]